MTLPFPVSAPSAAFAPEMKRALARVGLRPGLVFLHPSASLRASGHEQSSRLSHYFLAGPLVRGETVLVLDGANCFDPYRLAKWAKRWGRKMEMLRREREDLTQRTQRGAPFAPRCGAQGKEDAKNTQRTSRSLPSAALRVFDDCVPTGVGTALPSAGLGTSGMTSVEEVLRRVRVSRAFTCFQMAELVARAAGVARRYGARRVVLTGFPDIFDDEEISAAQAKAAFARTRPHIDRWRAAGLRALVFSDGALKPTPLRRWLERQLTHWATAVYRLEEGPAGLALREEKRPTSIVSAKADPSSRPFCERAGLGMTLVGRVG